MLSKLFKKSEIEDEINEIETLKQKAKDIRFLNLSKEISSWSKDPSTKVGAIIVGQKGQIVSSKGI